MKAHPMRLFDSHCHIDDAVYDKDFDAMLERAREAGVCAMMLAGVTHETCVKAIALAEAHPGLYASVGVHPHDAKSLTPKILEDFEAWAKKPVVRAIGETGLDFNRMFSPQKAQEEAFAVQLHLARKLHLPVIIHERDSGGRLLAMLASVGKDIEKGVIHCFSGSQKDLNAYLDLGYYIGITGIVTQKERGKGLRSLVRAIPKNRLVIETDAPYLTPAPARNRHRRNEPAFVAHVLTALANTLGEAPETLAPILFKNTCALFNVSPGV